MAITLRNKRVEDQIRMIGGETGEGPSAVIARAVQAEVDRLAAEKERRVQERLARMDAFLDSLPIPSDAERKAIWKELDDMYDEWGLPK
jgi:hypothetical protein